MSPTLIIAIVTVVLALILYTVGVWGQWLARRLKVWHLVFFWAGFFFDVTSTILMGSIAGGLKLDLHGFTGFLAFVLMLGNAVWASFALLQKREAVLRNFRKVSLGVWILWLIPFFSGAIGAMQR